MAAVPVPPGVLRSSGAGRWGNCAISFALEALYPEDTESPEAREGTAAHFVVTEDLEGRLVQVGDLAPNGHPIDADMVKHGAHYIADVRATMTEMLAADPQTLFRVETKVAAPKRIHPDNEGTPDTFAVSLKLRRAIVWDYKYGHGLVEAYLNGQCTDYLAQIFESLDLTDDDIKGLDVEVRIVQPRCYATDGIIRTWKATGSILLALFGALSASAYRAKAPGAHASTGRWCKDCNGRHACSAFQLVAGRAADVAMQATPVDLPPDALGAELQYLTVAMERLKARLVGLQEMAISNIRKGQPVANWTMGFVNSQERWSVPAAQVLAIGDMEGVNLRDPDPIKPAAARTAYKAAGVDEAVISALIVKPSGAAKLVPLDPSAAVKAFGPPPKA